MELNPWESISRKPDTIIPPDKVIEKTFSGLSEFSSQKVNFELNKVNFFPEEVTFPPSFETIAFGRSLEPKADPHPDFGYNPQEAKSEEFFRYRLLLYPAFREIKYELFKFKYPILFYPVTLYIDKKSFNLLEKDIPEEGNLEAGDRAILEDYITKIIQSDSTLELISRLMAL